MTIRSRTAAAAVLLAAVFGAAACGGDDSSSGATTTTGAATSAGGASTRRGASTTAAAASSELCQERDALRASITDLTNIDVLKNGTSALTEQMADIKQQAQAIASDAKGDMKPEAEALPDVRPEAGGRR